MSKTTIFKWMWLQRIVKVAIPNYVNTWTSWREIVDKFNNSICNLLKVLAVMTAAWEFTTSEKFKIGASFLRVDIRYRVGLQIFNNCDLLLRYICCFFVKYLRRLVISVLTISARERRNNAASLNLLQLNSFCVGVFFWSAFVIRVAGNTQLFLVIVSETIFLRGKSRVSTDSLNCC